MKAETLGRRTIETTHSIINIIVFTVIAAAIAFAGYALWDSNQLHQAADSLNYAIYKPTAENEGKSFKQLQALNGEVFAWLTVYETNIDYPVAQGQDNMKYVNTNAEGSYSVSGAIFLDCNNSRDFSDFNNILYGHHMEKKMMFGEIGDFADKKKFDSHRYGNLYFDEKDHGVEFFAFVHTDAYDSSVFKANVAQEARQEYLENLLAKAIHTRDIGVGTEDRIVLLSTCSSSSTNGRDILVGKLTDEVYEAPLSKTEAGDLTISGIGILEEINLLIILLITLLAALILVICYRRINRKGAENE